MPRRPKREYPDDDGRTIAPMDVDGMPWHVPVPDRPENRSNAAPPPPPEAPQLSKQEARWAALGAMKAGLLIAAVFGTAFAIVIALMLLVWRR